MKQAISSSRKGQAIAPEDGNALASNNTNTKMKISKKNKETIAQIPMELTIKTDCLKKALTEYPKDGGILVQGYQELVMETPARGRVLCGVSLSISVRKTLE